MAVSLASIARAAGTAAFANNSWLRTLDEHPDVFARSHLPYSQIRAEILTPRSYRSGGGDSSLRRLASIVERLFKIACIFVPLREQFGIRRGREHLYLWTGADRRGDGAFGA